MTRTTSSNEQPCPIWKEPPAPREMPHGGRPCNSPRAGGRFLLEYDGAVLLQRHLLTDRRRANLSYWIYRHNLEYRLFDAAPGLGGAPPVLDQAWVEDHRDRAPSAEDRLLTFLRELIRSDDATGSCGTAYLLAAGGCRHDGDLAELRQFSEKQGWLDIHSDRDDEYATGFQYFLKLPARIHVDERTLELGQERQGFVARWFDCSMDEPYEEGIACAIRAAGYEPRLINDRGFTGGVVDEILAEIRKSKFVVADFTSCGECEACEKCEHIGARGGVYFEAGFALGLGKPVFLTCRADRTKAVHFDINHLNRIQWKKPEDLREQLKNSILAVLDRGPLDPPDGQPADSRQPERTAAGS